MFARVDGGHFDAAFEEGEVFECDGFVFVVAYDVGHHVLGWEGVGGGGIAGEPETWGGVVFGVGDVESVCSEGSRWDLLACLLDQ